MAVNTDEASLLALLLCGAVLVLGSGDADPLGLEQKAASHLPSHSSSYLSSLERCQVLLWGGGGG